MKLSVREIVSASGRQRPAAFLLSWSTAVLGIVVVSQPCAASPVPAEKSSTFAVTPGFRPSRYPGVEVRELPGGVPSAKAGPGSGSMVFLRPGHTSASFASGVQGALTTGTGTTFAGKSRAKGVILLVPPGHFPYTTMARPVPGHAASASGNSVAAKKSAAGPHLPQAR